MIYRLCLAANFRTFETPVYMLLRLCDNAALRGSGRRCLALLSASFCNGGWILRLRGHTEKAITEASPAQNSAAPVIFWGCFSQF